MSDQDGELPEMNDGPPAESEPLSACPIDPEERLDTGRVLGLFAPRTPRLKRERLLALVAGVRREVEPRSRQAIQYRTPWYWPAMTSAMTITTITLAVLLAVRMSTPVRVEYKERIVFQPVSLPSAPAQPLPPKDEAVVTVSHPRPVDIVLSPAPPDDYLKTRSIALEQGVESIPFRQPLAQGNPPNSPATRDELLRQLGPTKTLRGSASQSLQTGMTRSWIWPGW